MGIRYNIVPTKVNLEEIEEIQKLHEEVEEFIEEIGRASCRERV